MTDAEIIRAVLVGDRGQFGELLRRYQGMVYGLAWHLLGDHTEAQDAAQEAFIAAYLRLPALLQPEKFPAWLRRITVNQCRMRQRRRKEVISWEQIPPETISHADTPAGLAEKAELRRQVHEAIACLPEAQRLAVTLFYLSGMSCEEAGRFLGVGANAVKGRLHRARVQLKEALMNSMEEVMNEQKPGEAFTAAALREIEKYEEQAQFHNGAIHAIGQLVPGAKGNVAAIVQCAYLASQFRYHTLPLIEVARLAAQCDHECPELAPIAELAVLSLSGTDHVVPLAQEAVKAKTSEERSRVQQTIERMRAAAGCANVEEALERQSRLLPPLPSLEHSSPFPDEDGLAENKTAALRDIKEYDRQAAFHHGAIRHMAWLAVDANANLAVIVRCAYLASKFGYNTAGLIEIARVAAQCDHECPELAAITELVVLSLSGTYDLVRLAQEAAKAQTGEERARVEQAIEQVRAGAGCASISEALERQSRLFPHLLPGHVPPAPAERDPAAG